LTGALVVPLPHSGLTGKAPITALGLVQSASSVGFSDTPTFTFWQVGYSSVWVDLQEVERYGSLNPTGGGFMPLQTPTARQAASVEVCVPTGPPRGRRSELRAWTTSRPIGP